MDSSISLPLPLGEQKPATEVIAPPVTRARTQPHIGWALLLTFGLFATLTFINIVWDIVAVVVATAHGQEITPTTAFEFGARNAAAILLSLFSASCIYCVGTAAIAFRDSLVQKLSFRRCTRTQFLAVLMLPLPLAIVVLTLVATLTSLTGLQQGASQVVADPPPLAVVLLAVAVLPAIGEEVFFRGLLSRGLIARHGIILGVLFATLLFSLAHGDPIQVAAIFFMGVVMQLVFLWTHSLLATILLHGLYNALIVIAGRNGISEICQTFNAASLPMVLMSLLTIAALLVMLFQTRTRWQLPDGKRWSPGYTATEMPPSQLHAIAVNARARLLPIMIAMLSFATLLTMVCLSAM